MQRAHHDVLQRGAMREKIEALEHHADLLAKLGVLGVGERNTAPGGVGAVADDSPSMRISPPS